jgi:AraC-like DNA-binding protein
VITDVLYYAELFMFIGFLGLFGIKQADIYRLVSTNSSSIPKIKELSEGMDSREKVLESIEKGQDQEPMVAVLDEGKKEQLKIRLLEVMEKQKPYLNPTLTITELAVQIDTNQKYLSVVINDCFHKNFFAFINEFRVNEAIKLLNTPVGQQYSIEGVGKTVGFNSRSTFITAFKKQTKTTPSDYKNN